MAARIGVHPPSGLPTIEDPSGVPRVLARLAPNPRAPFAAIGRRMALPAPDRWQEIEIVPWEPPHLMNQGQHGCHDDQTEVLTDQGWSLWSELQPGSLLGTANPVSGLLEFQAPEAIHVYEYNGPLIHVDHRRLDFALTPNHRLFVRRWNEAARTLQDRYDFVEAKDLGWYAGLPASTRGFLGINLERVSIPDSLECLGDDFVALVALVASDGWAGGTENTKDRVSFCCFRPDRYPMVASLAHRVGFREEPSRKGVWVRYDSPLAEWFRQNAYTGTTYRAPFKRVPAFVKAISQRQVELFLKFFGDQSSSSGNRCFFSSSRQLIDDLQELLLRVGRRGTITERPARDAHMRDGREILAENCHPELALVESRVGLLSVERKRQIRTDHYKGQVFCATVPNSTLITRRNGTVLISGNSCVGHGTCTAFEAAWTQAGQPRPPAPFSGCYIYGWVNGGQDQGAVISDAAASLRMHGVCTEREVPEGLIFLQQFPSAAHEVAGHYRPLSIMKCQTFEDICGALASGFPIVVGIIVGSNFSNLESSGVAPLPDQPLGGHCLAALGLKNHSRYGWCLEVQNSWDRWGIDGKGRCLLRREHFETPTDAFAVVSVATDPGSQPLPVATA